MGEVGVSDWAALFAGKRVLVTGHTGFKGSWLSLWLSELGADVVGYALAPRTPDDHCNAIRLQERISYVLADIRDEDSLRRVFREYAPEFVFHLAAQSLVRDSYANPKETYDVNVGGSVNVLEQVRQTPGVRVLVYVTSDKCYLNKEWVWAYREIDELGGHDPYSASKAAAEIVFGSYQRAFFQSMDALGAASVRAGNVIGGGDWAENRIIPDCIRALKRDECIVIRNPNAVRPWQHVLEPLGGYLYLAARLYEEPKEFAGAWNFGPPSRDTCTVKELVDRVIVLWGSGEVAAGNGQPGLYESGLLTLNCDKATQLLGWRPKWHLTEAVEQTVSWYKKQCHTTSTALELSRSQIERYMKADA
jgi:CDP-glucose 4,6-dehydratase